MEMIMTYFKNTYRKEDIFDKISRWIMYGVGILFLIMIIVQIVRAEDFVVDDGIPKHTSKFERDTLVTCFDDDTRQIVTEKFTPPVVLRDFGRITGILSSPVEAGRVVAGLNTCGIAQWHYWMFKEIMLQSAIRQYSGCVDELSVVMFLNGEKPINDPSHPFYPVLKQQVEYLVAFEGPQPFDYERSFDFDEVYDVNSQSYIKSWYGTPIAGVRHYQEHILAAIASINITANLNNLCQQTKVQYIQRFLNDFQRKPKSRK